MKRTRLNKKGKQVVMALSIIMIILLMLIIFVGIKLYEKYSPTKEKMAYTDYFEMTNNDQVLVYVNDEKLDITVLVDNGMCYLPQEYVVDNLNCRFYRDIETNCIMYTVADNIYSFATDQAYYTDLYGNTINTDYVIVKSLGDEFYIAIDYVKEKADFDYRFYTEPNRLIMWNQYVEKTYAKLTDDTAIRFRGGIKSPIISDGAENQEVEVLQDLEDWIEVRTEDGYMGYVSAKKVGDTYTRAAQSSFVPEAIPTPNLLNEKINLVYHAVGTSAYGGENLEGALASTRGINVLVPTWYKLSANDGTMTCYANASYVKKAHEMGLQVWALVEDLDTNLDKTAIFSSKTNRTNMINKLISDAAIYGFDGINIDFEQASSDNIEHYLQFIRELSLKCRANGLILSSDIYVPADFNLFYNRAEQSVWADYIVIMGYDEYWSTSPVSGPVASIGYVRDGITNTLSEVPKEQVINAMPYYVRIWYETKNSDGSVTVSSKAVGMDAAKKLLSDNSAPLMWDEEKALYYGSYETNGVTVRVWLEEEASIEAKMKLYAENDLAGIGGWRLGLETKAVWSVIEKYLN